MTPLLKHHRVYQHPSTLFLGVQIVKTPPPAEEAEVQAQLLLLQLQRNKLKQYPRLDAKQRDAASQVSGLR